MDYGPNTILVIDDDRDTLQLLKLAIERAGYRVVVAANWQEVNDQIQQVYRNNRKIDLIVLDLMMPERSGFDIMRALKIALVPMPPVIMLTAVTGLEQQIEASELGVAKYITKPTTPNKLLDSITKILSEKRKNKW
ncbi:MAG: response regulator [Aliifodinibius sp.]|nr:response regulator transcription factor [candidate division Zixibacteria bacterium]NIT60704.1 response regulator transcription factor [Fodinibius sp.]NIV15431.1 response regulator [Fodinibius sp.]NIY29286.1 response regulator [Fodinibius sp.]